jgi:hypothetical protein
MTGKDFFSLLKWKGRSESNGNLYFEVAHFIDALQ